MEQVVLAEIVKDSSNAKTNDKSSDILITNIDKYVIEIIRISEMYKFELKVRNVKQKKQQKNRIKPVSEQKTVEIKNIDDFVSNKEETKPIGNKEETKPIEEIKQYSIIAKENSEEISVSYNFSAVSTKEEEHKAESSEYGIKLNLKYQELWEKTGFYQERTNMAKAKVQMWPEHLPYDHVKRKRAFLFT